MFQRLPFRIFLFLGAWCRVVVEGVRVHDRVSRLSTDHVELYRTFLAITDVGFRASSKAI